MSVPINFIATSLMLAFLIYATRRGLLGQLMQIVGLGGAPNASGFTPMFSGKTLKG